MEFPAVAGGVRPGRVRVFGADVRPVGSFFATMLALALLVVTTLVAPVDHDESQYVAAVAAMRHGLPFRDFAYLQTPLQPLLFAPFAMLPPGWLVLGLRLANALCALATLTFVGILLRRQGVARAPAAVAVLLLLTSNAFLFAGSVARNDALPMLFFAAGLGAAMCLVSRPRTERRVAGMAGLLLAAAVSTKISYALPAGAIGAALLAMRAMTPRQIAEFTLGGIAGLLPTIILAALAPDAAWFGIIDYSLIAPQQWRALVGRADMLSPLAKLGRLAAFAALGAPLIALLAMLADRVRGDSRGDRRVMLLDAAIVGGLVAAYLPDPTYRQYLVPLLPALFLRLGLLLAKVRMRRGHVAVIALCVVSGLAPTLIALAAAAGQGASPALSLVRDARAVRGAVGDAPVTTLAPERVVGAGVAIDMRFVAGPFLFRILPPASAHVPARWPVMGMADARRLLDAAPPRALLTGTEARPFRGNPRGLDGILESWALRRGYSRHRLPSGTVWLWLPPGSARSDGTPPIIGRPTQA